MAPERPVRFARLTFSCQHCHLAPRMPVTGPCGHTSCYECAVFASYCPCEEAYYETINVDVLLQKLMQLVQTTVVSIPEQREVYGRVTKRTSASKLKIKNRVHASVNGPTKNIHPVGTPRMKPVNFTSMVRNARPSFLWLLKAELECSVCCQSLRRPVCTPCGHTFCRPCIERALDFCQTCPLCKTTLSLFNVDATEDTDGVCLALRAAACPVDLPPEHASDEMPLFACTVAYPDISCLLHVFEPRYRLMLRRVIRSPSRRFGMVPLGQCGTCPKYGTLLEVRDVVRMRDGSSVVTTVGVARFQVLSRRERDGYQVAAVRLLADQSTHEPAALTDMMTRISSKMQHWVQSRLSPQTRSEILKSYGPMPPVGKNTQNDGPALCWWLLAILPLPPEVKVTILRTLCPMRRLWVLEHLLSFIESEGGCCGA